MLVCFEWDMSHEGGIAVKQERFVDAHIYPLHRVGVQCICLSI
jgi:hypothetical protein